MEICEKSLCSGCGMCSNICPVSAIEMRKNKYGFKFPVIDEIKCIACNYCITRCPSNNVKKRDSNIKQIYAAWNRDENIRKKSTSGGIFSALSKKILSQKGYIVGVQWKENFETEHILISHESELKKLTGSKYVQSDTKQIYLEIEKKLKTGKKVLFSGTPCQNKALKNFLRREYENLYQIDLICHGVPSSDVFQKYLNEMTNNDINKIKEIHLRDKVQFWDYSNVTIKFKGREPYSVPTVDDPYFTLFNIGFTLRESCRKCIYTNTYRYSDITLADFWGFIPKNMKMSNYEKGTSCVLINSAKGEKLFFDISDNLIFEKRSLAEVKKGNKALSSPFSLPEDQISLFWNDYENGLTIKELCNKYIPHPFAKPKFLFLRILKRKYLWLLRSKND